MSLYYINEHLIEEDVTTSGTWSGNGSGWDETYDRIMLRTTSSAVRKTDDGDFESFTKPICVHNLSRSVSVKTRITSTIPKDSKFARVTVRSSTDTRYDSDVFIVALPYNGMIKPFQHDEEALSIFKSMIIKSDKLNILHEDNTYKRVAYFICRPHHSYMGNDGWYGKSCNLSVTFAQSNRNAHGMTDETAEWTFTTHTIRFGEDGQYELHTDVETAPYDSFNPDDIHKVPICNLVKPTKITD